MKYKYLILLAVFALTGCPVNEIDKCVDAQVKAELTVCRDINEEDLKKKCKKETAISAEAEARLACLKANAGH